mgnify:CR=1 FL=1
MEYSLSVEARRTKITKFSDDKLGYEYLSFLDEPSESEYANVEFYGLYMP